jgi:hypothetical protein
MVEGAGSLVASGTLKTVDFIFLSPFLSFLLGSLMVIALVFFFGVAAHLQNHGAKNHRAQAGRFSVLRPGALPLFLANALDAPVSIPHAITGAIVGIAGNIVLLSRLVRSSLPWFMGSAASFFDSLRNFSRFFDLVFEIALKAESNAAHESGSAYQQCQHNGADSQPVGLTRFCLWRQMGVEAGIPLFRRHQAVDDGGQSAAGNGEAKQRYQYPTPWVVNTELLNPLYAIQAQGGG